MLRKPLFTLGLLAVTTLAQAAQTIDVYRDPNCGCCKAWISHLRDNGFTVNDHVEPNMSAVKQRLGVAPRLASCHTGVIDGKFVEGHVPAEQVRLLAARDDLKGLAVPGMPMGSPGMEMGDQKDAYQVIGVTQDGKGHRGRRLLMLSLWALFLSAFGAATLLPLQSEAVLVGLLLRQPDAWLTLLLVATRGQRARLGGQLAAGPSDRALASPALVPVQ